MRRSFHLGFDYYPEHWPEAMWADDLRLMREAGVTVVRIAEFAWSRMEPAEGRFELDWLDRFFSVLRKALANCRSQSGVRRSKRTSR